MSRAPAPFLKWLGGKRQAVSIIKALLPEKFNRYHEPFLGGGAVFFSLGVKQAVLGDINEELILTFSAIRDKVEEVIEQLDQLEYNKETFLNLRAQDPEHMPISKLAARMVYLNKCGFNGLYRVNKKGKFNAPFGRHKKPPVFLDAELLKACSKALKGSILTAGPFDKTLDYVSEGDLVYLDPPYVKSDNSSFVGFSRFGFTEEDQERLADLVNNLTNKGVYVIYSNLKSPWVKNRLGKYNIFELDMSRRVGGYQGRGKVKELLITNFDWQSGGKIVTAEN